MRALHPANCYPDRKHIIPPHYRRSDFFPVSDFPLAVMSVSHPGALAEHDHDFIELVFVTQGNGINCYDSGATLEFLTGDIFTIVPGERHAFAECRNLWIFNILFTQALLGDELDAVLALPNCGKLLSPAPREYPFKLSIPMSFFAEAVDRANRIVLEMSERKNGFRISARAALLDFLVLLGRIPEAPAIPQEENAESIHHQAIYRSAAFIERNLTAPLTLAKIAESAHMSRAYFCRQFKAITGVAPWDYLTERRLEKARHLLSSSDLPVAEIALKCGFCDGSYFTKIFRKNCNQTPLQYRRSTFKREMIVYTHRPQDAPQ